MSLDPIITYNGNQRTIAYDIREESQAARAKTEAELLAGGASAIAADSAANSAGLTATDAALTKLYAQEAARPPATSDDNPNAGTTDNIAKPPEGFNPDGGFAVNMSGTNYTIPSSSPPLVNPGARKTNPLSNYSSSTYSITLYMITSEYYNNYSTSNPPGKLPNMSDQIYVVAQSGGVDNSFDNRLLTKSGQLGKGQPGLDYYIEDFNLTTLLPGAQKASMASEIKFKIIEPNGFTFMQKLKVASAIIDKKSTAVKSSTAHPTPIQQNFMLGIRFYGYDKYGNIVKSGGPPNSVVQNSDSTSVSERFLPIKISSIKFKLNAESTIYSCEAFQLAEQVAYSKINGVIKTNAEINGSTVGEVLGGSANASPTSKSLQQFMNKFNFDQKTNGGVTDPTTYKIEFIGGASKIAAASLIDNDESQAKTASISTVSTTDKGTVAKSFKATSYNPNTKSVSIPAGTPLLQAIDNIIIKSSFITEATSKVNTSSPETKSVKNAGTKALQWYSINPLVKVKGRDPKTNDWIYEITYQIGLYDISYIRNNYVNGVSPYPGPFKLYNYLLTGLNSEVLEYEMNYDNLYYIPVSASAKGAVAGQSGKNYEVPKGTQNSSNSDPQSGKPNKGSEINDNIRASLYSPSDQAQAKIKIIGDPDWIMTTVGTDQKVSQSASTSAKSYYGSDFTINPLAGQTYLQIIFNVAEDYLNNGLMDVSDKIQFYNSDAIEKNGLKGLIYKVWQVESSFSKGQFTQTLECIIVPASQLAASKPGATAATSSASPGANDSKEAVADTAPTNSQTNEGGTTAEQLRTDTNDYRELDRAGISTNFNGTPTDQAGTSSTILNNNSASGNGTAAYPKDDTVLPSTASQPTQSMNTRTEGETTTTSGYDKNGDLVTTTYRPTTIREMSDEDWAKIQARYTRK